jgi:serine protease inhibitor
MGLIRIPAVVSVLFGAAGVWSFSHVAALTGVVTDEGGKAVYGASIMLAKAGVSTYSDRSGKFTLDNIPLRAVGRQAAHGGPALYVKNNTLRIVSNRSGLAVRAELFDLSGRRLAVLLDDRIEKGAYSVRLTGRTAHCVLLLRVRCGSEEFMCRVNPSCIAPSAGPFAPAAVPEPLAKATVETAIDSIVIDKYGFGRKITAVSSYSGDAGAIALEIDKDKQLDRSDSLLSSANTRFGFRLFKSLVDSFPDSNVIISPFSISQALTMTYNGSAGATYDSMKSVLELGGMTDNEINSSSKRLRERLVHIDPKVSSAIANSIWCDSGESIKDSFLEVNRTFFDATVRAINFDIPASADTINQWVSDNTNGRITEMVGKSISNDILMILLNAVYFKGEWEYGFNKDSTHDGTFFSKPSTPVNCRMMYQQGYYRCYSHRFFRAVEIPYGFSDFSMVLLLPNAASLMDSVVRTLDAENWNTWTNGFRQDTCYITLPKFKCENDFQLEDALTALGMGIAFNGVDFSRISNFGLQISEVRHRTFFLITEEGTEAAACTKVSLSYGFDPRYIFNQPFLFVIWEKKSRSVLFVGKVAVPVAVD